MILVGQYDSPFVRRVAISLHKLDLPFERDTRSVFADAAAMRRVNPLGRIPSLVLDDGEVLIDSAAILDHIDQVVGPDRALLPSAGAARRQALRISALGAGAVDKAGAIAYERLLRPADKIHQPWLDRCAEQLASALGVLETLEPAPWLLGSRLMQPDIMVGAMLGYLKLRVPDAFPTGRYPALERFSDRCESEAELQKTRPAADEVMPSGV
ncbi:glutathione S-transferase family protein [Vineibacter terrae]|uniref:Glutathione S-transferase family protein n=1 Tax=Vineibacter terrae TaxID=2586908 RepID=A0A5C8PEL6_9HYPH|nr:glutathione S-transferase family protein [Vineibacter terrae]TXL72207.1 glutathione S-transferase family protein [Vineibacter terrae]